MGCYSNMKRGLKDDGRGIKIGNNSLPQDMKDSTIDEEKPVIRKELFFVYKYTHAFPLYYILHKITNNSLYAVFILEIYHGPK